MMNFVEEITEIIDNNPDHILYYLKKRENSGYYNDFIDAMKKIESTGVISSNKVKKSLFNKLLLDSKKPFDANKYLQGVSEMMYWIYAAEKCMKIKTDCKINSENKTDVDVKLYGEDYSINIEVKCPTQDGLAPDMLSLGLANRIPGLSKYESDKEMRYLQFLIQPGIDLHPEMGIIGSEIKKTNDNKIITFMDSAQKKFIYSNSDINILVISVPSKEMQNYYNYLCNSLSGILTEGIREFGRKSEEFDKIDFVMLTNIVSGHDKDIKINAWDLRQYCSIGFVNPHSKAIRCNSKRIIGKDVLVPNEFRRFKQVRDKILDRDLPRGIPAEEMFVYEYLVIYYSNLYRADERRDFWYCQNKVNEKIFK